MVVICKERITIRLISIIFMYGVPRINHHTSEKVEVGMVVLKMKLKKSVGKTTVFSHWVKQA